MASRIPRRSREAQLAFDALSIEGGLLATEWIARVAALTAGHQTESDYEIDKGLNLRDEIGRYWRIAQAHWGELEAGLAAKGDPDALAQRFVRSLLTKVLGFDLAQSQGPVVIREREYPVPLFGLGRKVPVVVAPAGTGLDAPLPELADGTRRRSAFGLAQEYLNASSEALWGLSSDGLTLRLLRDNASLTRPAWVEADLARIFREGLYPDFTALWLLSHSSRFGRADQAPEACPLETWRKEGQEQGTRAREKLRQGVEEALAVLGHGFLSHRNNTALRNALFDGTLSADDYFGELLRLVYRLIFLLTAEERDLLHPRGTRRAVRELYSQGYSLVRLRERAVRRSAHDRHGDLWQALKIVLRSLAEGEDRLGLPALGGLFDKQQTPHLDASVVENRALLMALFRLCWLKNDAGLERVNWRDMGPEELGSVYESLLELVPRISQDGRAFSFATDEQGRATARKETGSFYTPDSLVQALLDCSLEPVIERTIASNPANPAKALLDLAVVDPACGSGHFLLSAARRIAARVAQLRAAGTPSADEYRDALRAVVGRCVYGVDLNPMAVELCQVALWMEAMVPGRPLSFLRAHIQHGNALVGTTPELMKEGPPDAAWEHIEGDEKPVCRRLKKANGTWRQQSLLNAIAAQETQQIAALSKAAEEAPDDSLEDVHAKAKAWEDYLEHPATKRRLLLSDLWCAAFFWPKVSGDMERWAPVRGLFELARTKPENLPPTTKRVTRELYERYRFFHWPIAFPQVWARGGFDVVLGNPPWDTLSPDAKEFFARWEPQIRFQPKDEQDATIAVLTDLPEIKKEWADYRRKLYSWVHFFKKSGRYTMYAPGNLGKGDFNVYRMFVEHALRTVHAGGYASQLTPKGIYGGANCAAIRKHLFTECRLTRIIGLVNTTEVWFKGIDATTRFALYSAKLGESTDQFSIRFDVSSEAGLRDALDSPLRLPVSLVEEFSPAALAVMEFESQFDINIAGKMYNGWPKFGSDVEALPYRHFLREIDMGTDRSLFEGSATGLPLYEGRMVSLYDHRAKGYRSGRARAAVWEELPFGSSTKSIQPQWLFPEEKIPEKIGSRHLRWRVGFCDIARPGTERSLMAALLPRGVLAGHPVPTICYGPEEDWAYLPLLAVFNSYCLDWIGRQKITLHLTFTILDSLPIPRLPIDHPAVTALAPRVLRLTCTGPEMIPFWNAMAEHGWVEAVDPEGPVPGLLDEDERLSTVAEIEVIVARDLYSLTAAEMAHVLDTFPIVDRRQTAKYGEYRTKRLVLEGFERMPRVVEN